MIKHFAVLLCLSLSLTGQAQKHFTLEESILKAGTDFAPEKLKQLKWIPESELLSQVKANNGTESIWSFESNGRPKEELITLDQINKSLDDADKLKSIPYFEWLDNKHILYSIKNSYYTTAVGNGSTRKLTTLPDNVVAELFDKTHEHVAYVSNDNLYVQTLKGAETKQITTDGGNGIVYGQSVHRNEFGIEGGLFWAPTGERLAFYRMDESMVTEYPLVDISTKPASLNEIRYPMAGQRSHEVTLGVYDLKTGKTVYMNTDGDKEHYLTSITWTPDAKSIIIAVLNRDQNHMEVNLYDALTGNLIRKIFEENSDKYVEPEHPAWFIPNHPEQFLWFSERDGYQHLYHYKTSGEFIQPITNGKWEVKKILGFDQSGKHLLLEGTGEIIIDGPVMNTEYNGTQTYIYSVDFELLGRKRLDDTKGTHHASLNDLGTSFIHYFSSVDVPSNIDVRSANGEVLGTLLKAKNPMEGYVLSKPEIFNLSSGDGSPLYTRIIKPSNFDPKKKYPVLVYVYGGPHVQLVVNSWQGGASLWMYWMAEQGYIIATVDNHGSANRGLEFEQATFRKLGKMEIEDQKVLIDYLQSMPYVDKERMALHGWSFGGFMTINMLLTFPGVFKAGVAGGPVCDWSMYEIMYTERYMDTPESNPDGYALSNLVKRAPALKDDLLIIHGTVDDVVVWQHSQSFLKSCIDSGIQLDYFIYPGHEHNVRGKDRVHLMTKVLGYIDDRIGNP